jgi:hypothetical protein
MENQGRNGKPRTRKFGLDGEFKSPVTGDGDRTAMRSFDFLVFS